MVASLPLDFGKPIGPVEVKTEVLKSEHSAEELVEMGRTLRTPLAEGMAGL